MRAFEYVRAADTTAAVALVAGDSEAQYLAGGTTQLDLMLKDGGRAGAAGRHHAVAAARDHHR
jgi:CO/xanthine dehydrogenase FAD-binding subunit